MLLKNCEGAYERRIGEIIKRLKQDDTSGRLYLREVESTFLSLKPLYLRRPELFISGILERIAIPERIVVFRVPWTDDGGNLKVTTGVRVQHSSALGAYKGGLRFSPKLTVDTVKSLAFSQTLKNALTGVFMGGGKGGSNFDPKGKSDGEIMRFCQSFVTGLYHNVGKDLDIPAGDIGVGEREIGYMFGQYKRLTGDCGGSFTGKPVGIGGSKLRKQATGYGLVYFTEDILSSVGDNLKGKRVVVSGSGNVALYCIKKVQELGAFVVAASDSDGYVLDENGIDFEILRRIKEDERGRIKKYAEVVKSAVFYADAKKLWTEKTDIALPCATQNEIDEYSAATLVKNGCTAVAEGSNSACTPAAIEIFKNSGVIFAPGKAANAGGVAVSGFEIMQNASRRYMTESEADGELKRVMKNIRFTCERTAAEYGKVGDYAMGANIAAYIRVAEAVAVQGY